MLHLTLYAPFGTLVIPRSSEELTVAAVGGNLVHQIMATQYTYAQIHNDQFY